MIRKAHLALLGGLQVLQAAQATVSVARSWQWMMWPLLPVHGAGGGHHCGYAAYAVLVPARCGMIVLADASVG